MPGRLISWARESYEQHQEFFLLALLFTSFRFLTLLLFEPGGYIIDWSGYYVPGASFVQLSDWGYYPIIHYWMEYPPLFPWLSVLTYRLSLFVPMWRDPGLWYNLLLGSAFLLFEMGNFALIYAIALKLKGKAGAVRCAWLYAGLFFPAMTLLFWFENFALFFLLLGVYMILARRPVWAGLAAGVGFMVKLVPAFIAPVALRVFPKVSNKVIYAAVAVCVALLIALPFLPSHANFLLAPFLYHGDIGPWESIWALLDGYYSGGETTPLETRFDPADISVSLGESTFPYGVVVVAFLAIYLVLYTRHIDWQDNTKAVAFCGLSISLFLIFSKGYSPQWIINLLPFIVLLMPNLRGVTYSIFLMGANVLEFPIALVLLAQHPWLFIIAVLLRTALLAMVTVEFVVVLFPSPAAKKALGLALSALVLLVIILGPPTAVLGLRDYSAERLGESPYRDTIAFLGQEPPGAVIFTDQRLYQQTYGFLVGRHGLYLLESDELLPDTLARLAGRHQLTYVVYTGSEDDLRINPTIEAWLSRNAFPLGTDWLDNARVTRYSAPSSALQEHVVEATFAGQIELVSCSFEPRPLALGRVLHVSLNWKPLGVPQSDYTVFVHLTDEGGRVWAQHDGQPVGGSRPTSSWKAGEQIEDHHGLAFAAGLPPGEYRLAVGLYEASTGERLQVDVPDEETPADRVLIGPVLLAPEGT